MSEHNYKTAFVSGLVDDKCDPKLGAEVKKHLQKVGLDTTSGIYEPEKAFADLERGVEDAFNRLGLSTYTDPSVKDTPKRFAKMFIGELTRGLNYDFFPRMTTVPNGNLVTKEAPETRSQISPEDKEQKEVVGAYDQMVLVESIRTTSLCEHHLQTIDGFTHIAYIPNEKVLGLSKFARVTEFFAARPQIQERMTEQIYHALSYVLETEDIAVVQKAVHFCMRARGVKQPESWTQTNKMGGRFLTNAEMRKEFLDAI